MSDVGPAITRIDRGPGQVVLSDLEKRFDDVLAVRRRGVLLVARAVGLWKDDNSEDDRWV